jgi:SAM-dependent methyltransferase
VFRSTAKLQVLHEDAPVSLKHYAQASSGPAFWLPAVYLPQVVASGCNHSDKALGCSPFEYFAQHKDEARQFSEAMTDLSTPVIRDAVSVIDVGDARIVVDVGGANGAFACELVQCSSQVSALVLELPHVVAGVAEEAGQRGLEDKVTGVPGDFFVSVPSGDLYLLKFVLHNWDDEACVKILSNIRRAMRPGARLVIVEMAVATSGATASAALMDMAMLFALNGQERELPQFEELLRRAGLRSTRVIAIRSPYYVIEAEVASSDSTSHRNNGRWSPKRVRPGPGQGIA